MHSLVCVCAPCTEYLCVVCSILRFSEYQSNYQSPTRRSYINGAWMGAPCPELLMEVGGVASGVGVMSERRERGGRVEV